MKISVVDYLAPDAPQQFEKSFKETGFAVLENHPLNNELIARMYKSWKIFFDSEEKNQFPFDPAVQSGYADPNRSEKAKGNDVKDIKEFYDYVKYRTDYIPAHLKQDMDLYFANAEKLCEQLLGWLDAIAPKEVKARFSMPLSQMVQGSKNTVLRVLHFPPFTGNEEPGAVRAAAHEDISMLTVLPVATSKGLQAFDLKNQSWVEVPTRSDWVVVNVGDTLQEATGHYYPSTKHRVVNPEGEARTEARMSMPTFFHPRPDVQLSSRYTAGEYLRERLVEIGLLSENEESETCLQAETVE